MTCDELKPGDLFGLAAVPTDLRVVYKFIRLTGVRNNIAVVEDGNGDQYQVRGDTEVVFLQRGVSNW